MRAILNYPVLVFFITFAGMTAAAWLGALFAKRSPAQGEPPDILRVVEGATLTLLGLIIGFSFSMAVNRYDQRKDLEEAEANAIGTEYIRLDLVPEPAAGKVRASLRSYVEQRREFYLVRDGQQLERIGVETRRLQAELWGGVKTAALAQPSPLTALVVAGMNDVLNAEGYTQAAWWNRVPVAAWILMFVIAGGANVLVGFGSRDGRAHAKLFLVLPLLIATAFMLIADIDTPRGGIIRVVPQNIQQVERSMG